jgi:hypothetical protein
MSHFENYCEELWFDENQDMMNTKPRVTSRRQQSNKFRGKEEEEEEELGTGEWAPGRLGNKATTMRFVQRLALIPPTSSSSFPTSQKFPYTIDGMGCIPAFMRCNQCTPQLYAGDPRVANERHQQQTSMRSWLERGLYLRNRTKPLGTTGVFVLPYHRNFPNSS